ncbi:hypothetical protein [Burkholderia plantarii]|uniref:hypothetical protein n=1 Tax=Burkholderia plantarii TaxID=41899 RepID=UPI0018DE2E64|nr:hypothetical protein [Burkholderia plantarii]MBI0330924.1 hypothetical protein [Burkholderia plantarii]
MPDNRRRLTDVTEAAIPRPSHTATTHTPIGTSPLARSQREAKQKAEPVQNRFGLLENFIAKENVVANYRLSPFKPRVTDSA